MTNRTLLTAALLLPALALAAPAGDRYIIGFADQVRGRAAVQAAGGRVVLELGPQGAAAAVLPDAALEALSNNPAIAYIEPDAPRYPLSETKPYGIDLVQAPEVWSANGFSGSQVTNRTLCIIDSGLKMSHEDHAKANITGYPAGWDNDLCGHGTHVAGTIAALGDNGLGVVGVLKNGVKLHIVQVFTGAACDWTYSSTLVDALNKCVAAGANVVSMSLGGTFSSRTEKNAFAEANTNGVLSIAAAGNDGNSRVSYPAGYDSVMSVAAVDQNEVKADFSQYNSTVDIAAPGVGVLSTVPWASTNRVTVTAADGSKHQFDGSHMEGAASTTAAGITGDLVAGGLCDSTNAAWATKTVLCERGTISFADKVLNVKNSGGVAAIVYNNAAGDFAGTLGDTTSTIPAVCLSQANGQALLNHLGESTNVVALFDPSGSGYESWDGTSMATPHVSGVAALIWSFNPAWTNAQVRSALESTAKDLGAAGRDNEYGHGLVQAKEAKAALDKLQAPPPPPPPPPPSAPFVLSAKLSTKGKSASANLSWSGAGAPTVDIYRNGAVVQAGTADDGSQKDTLPGRGTYTYKLCDAGGTSHCSNDATVTY